LPTDETLEGLYTKHGEKWVLDIEEAVPKSQLDEFRTNNTTLKEKLEAYGDITPERAKELVTKEADWKGGNAKTKEQIDAAVEERVKTMKDTHDAALTALQGKYDKAQADLQSHVIDGAIIAAGTELGLRPGAHEDLTWRARKSFKLDEHGKAVA